MIITNGQATVYTETTYTDPRFGTRHAKRGEPVYTGICQWRYNNSDLRTPTQGFQRETAILEVLIPHTPGITTLKQLSLEIKTETETTQADIFRVEHLPLVSVTRLTATLKTKSTPVR